MLATNILIYVTHHTLVACMVALLFSSSSEKKPPRSEIRTRILRRADPLCIQRGPVTLKPPVPLNQHYAGLGVDNLDYPDTS